MRAVGSFPYMNVPMMGVSSTLRRCRRALRSPAIISGRLLRAFSVVVWRRSQKESLASSVCPPWGAYAPNMVQRGIVFISVLMRRDEIGGCVSDFVYYGSAEYHSHSCVFHCVGSFVLFSFSFSTAFGVLDVLFFKG